MSDKTITIHQGTGENALEMTVQVTQEEYDMMEKIRTKDPSSWENRELDLVKKAKEALEGHNNTPVPSIPKTNWKIIIGLLFGAIVIVGIILFANNRKKESTSIAQPSNSPVINSSIPNSSNLSIKETPTNDYEQWVSIPSANWEANNRIPFDVTVDDNEEEYSFGLCIKHADNYRYSNLYVFLHTIMPNGAIVHDTIQCFLATTEGEWCGANSNGERKLYVTLNPSIHFPQKGVYHFELEHAMSDPVLIGISEIGLFIRKSVVDWEQVLADFMATKEAEPNLTMTEWFTQFPEFNNDEQLLQAAFDYDATVKSGKYSNETELRSRFPEFWPGYQSQQLTTFSSEQYGFIYQYNNKDFELVEKINKNSHCVMKLQSPVDYFKSTLVSVWENPTFSSSYDLDFVSSVQSTDQGMGSIITSAVKTKVDGVTALKSELKIDPPTGGSYAAIFRIIHRNRMYMLNVYLPIEEYNNNKSFADECAGNFKFN